MIFEGCFSISLLLFLLVERLSNAAGFLLYRLVFGAQDDAIKGYASVQLIGSGATYLASLLSTIAQVLSATLSGLASYAVWATVVMLCFSLLYIVQEYYPEILINGVGYWNRSMGPVIATAFLAPARMADVVFSAVVPIYNFVVWVGVQLFYNTLVSNAVHDMAPYVDLGMSVAATATRLAISVSDYVQDIATPCPAPVTDRCYDPGQRTMDLITPMSGLRMVAGNLTR